MFSFDISSLASTIEETSFHANIINQFFKSSATYNSLLQKNTTTKFIKLDLAGRIFKSNKNLFIRSISIYFDNTEKKTTSLKLSIQNHKGEFVDSPGLRIGYGDRAAFFPDTFANQFEIKYSGTGARPRVTKIEVYGIDFDSIEKQRDTIARFFDAAFKVEKEIEKATAQITSLSSKNSEIEEKIKANNALLTSSNEMLEEKRIAVKQLIDQSFEIARSIESQRKRFAEVSESEIQKHNNIEQLDSQANALNIDISEKKTRACKNRQR